MNLLRATSTQPTYENFIAQCPHCGFENVFNRASDLKKHTFISYLEVICFECKSKFYINGDIAAKKYEYLLYDAELLINQKRFMYCILNTTQALESFFGRYLEIIFVDQPLTRCVVRTLEEGNALGEALYSVISSKTYFALCNIFIRSVLSSHCFKDSDEIREGLNTIKLWSKKSEMPSNKVISSFSDKEVGQLLLDLKKFNVHQIRNKVVHRAAYRPTYEEAREYLQEARRLVFRLSRKLDLEQDAISSLSPN